MAKIEIKDKTILFDDVDSDLINHKWFLIPSGYVIAKINQRLTYMHRLILSRKLNRELTSKEDTDHINRIRVDNRRENLRPATRSQNLRNKEPSKKSASGYMGVYKDMSYTKKPWKVQVGRKTIGRFATIEDAVNERDDYIKKNNLKFYRLSYE